MLHKLSKLRGYHVVASDGVAGHVDDFLVDEGFCLQHLVVDTSNWPGGTSVLISPAAIVRIDSPNKEIRARISRDEILHSPLMDSVEIELIETLPPALI